MDINKHDTYVIPHNFQDSGGIFRGIFKARNLAEGVIMAAVVIMVIVNTDLPDTPKFVLSGLFGIALFFTGAAGIDSQPFTTFLGSVLIFYLRKRKLAYREDFDSNEKSKIIRKEEKGMWGNSGVHRRQSYSERNHRNERRPVRENTRNKAD